MVKGRERQRQSHRNRDRDAETEGNAQKEKKMEGKRYGRKTAKEKDMSSIISMDT